MRETPASLTCFISLALIFLVSLLIATPQSRPPSKRRRKRDEEQKPSSWEQIKNLLTCKQVEESHVHDPRIPVPSRNGYSKLGSCSSLCSVRDVVHGNTRLIHRDTSPENSAAGSSCQESALLGQSGVAVPATGSTCSSSSTRSNLGSSASFSSRRMQLRKLSGCYECHMIVDPSRYPCPRATIFACSQCGEVFVKAESLEIHQTIRHAVSELGPEDSGRNIVEIIFKSSWLKKESPICKIERILKVHNSQKTVASFEDYRETVKTKENRAGVKKNPRCIADGNELLRFHCTNFTCSIGIDGSTSLCNSTPCCGVCSVIKNGFTGKMITEKGLCTTASSGRAHDKMQATEEESGKTAMLVCRVIAGRVKRSSEEAPPVAVEEEMLLGGCYDSVAGQAGIYSELDELYVSNPRAILPCFVVIYRAID